MQEERTAAISLANKVVESLKLHAVQVILLTARISVSFSGSHLFIFFNVFFFHKFLNLHLQARIFEGMEPIQFFSIFQSVIMFKVCWNDEMCYKTGFFTFFFPKTLYNFLTSLCWWISNTNYSKTLQGGVSSGYKNYLLEKELTDATYSEDGIALFRVQGYGPENMQAIQVETVHLAQRNCYLFLNEYFGSVEWLLFGQWFVE